MAPSSLDSGSDGSSNGDPFYLEALLRRLPKQSPPKQQLESKPPDDTGSLSEGDPDGDPFYLEALLKRLPKDPIPIDDDSPGKDPVCSQNTSMRQAPIMERKIQTRALPNSFSEKPLIAKRRVRRRQPSASPIWRSSMSSKAGSGKSSRTMSAAIGMSFYDTMRSRIYVGFASQTASRRMK